MAAPASCALRPPPAGWLLNSSYNQSSTCGQRRPPLLKVAKPQLSRSAPRPGKCAAASEDARHELRATEYYQFDEEEPLWLAVIRDLAAGFKALVAFLAEQPRQLKHLEWPGLQNTLKTATLTLVLVAVFIVALSTVDASLCYVLAWLLRKSA